MARDARAYWQQAFDCFPYDFKLRKIFEHPFVFEGY